MHAQCEQRVAIRQAYVEESSRLAEIAAASDVRNLQSLRKGFLLFPWTEAQFRAHMHHGSLLYVFADAKDSVIGFLSGFTSSDVDHRLEDSREGMQACLLEAIRNAAQQQGDADYAIVYQLALAPEFKSKGMGAECYKLFAAHVSGPFYGVVLEQPICCIRRVFWTALGFRRVGEVSLPSPASLATRFAVQSPETVLTWGIFRNPNSLYHKEVL
jgi:hypothetical protein